MKGMILAVALLAPVTACKKSSDADSVIQLPEATHRGANTLGCMVNGKPFVVKGRASISNRIGVDFIPFINNAWIADGNLGGGNYLRLAFNANGETTPLRIYEMSDNFPAGAKITQSTNGSAITGSNEFKTNALNKCILTLTYYDSIVAAGTFYFDAVNDSGEVVHITDGRFDIKL